MAAPGRLTALLTAVLIALATIGFGSAWALGRSGAVTGTAGPAPIADIDAEPAGAVDVDMDQLGTVASPSMTGSGDQGSADETEPPAVEPGPTPLEVVVAPRAASARYAAQVADLLQRYFTAINHGDYDAWLTTVSTDQAVRERTGWEHDYSTTFDEDIIITDIEHGDQLTVRIQFTSHQDVEFAPPDLPETCVRWDVIYEIVDEGVGLRVGLSAAPPAMAPCAAAAETGG